MSKIPYIFRTPIPAFFYSGGYLDPTKESFENRIKFRTWAFSKCYVVPSVREGIHYEPYEFSFSFRTAYEESGLTEKSFRVQLNYHIDNVFLEMKPNEIKNRSHTYRWQVHKFMEKIVQIDSQIEDQKQGHTDFKEGRIAINSKEKEGHTDLRDKTSEKGHTDFKKDTPKDTPKGTPIYEIKLEEKGTQKGTQKGTFYRTIEQREVCLKETNNNKEKPEPEPIPSKDLSLFLREKDLFISSKEKELKEQKQALEAYIDFRG